MNSCSMNVTIVSILHSCTVARLWNFLRLQGLLEERTIVTYLFNRGAAEVLQIRDLASQGFHVKTTHTKSVFTRNHPFG